MAPDELQLAPLHQAVFVEGHNEDIGRGVSPFSHRTGDLREPPKKGWCERCFRTENELVPYINIDFLDFRGS